MTLAEQAATFDAFDLYQALADEADAIIADMISPAPEYWQQAS